MNHTRILSICQYWKSHIVVIGIFDYLMKPPNTTDINNLLKRAHSEYTEKRYIVNFKWQGLAYALEVSEIVYLEGYSRHVAFFTPDEKYKCVGKLDEYDMKLAPYGFLRCHQGFLVNMKYIKSIDKDRIKTTTGAFVEMSVRKRQECLQAFNNYLTRYRV